MNTGLAVATRSGDEIADAIRAFKPADWARLAMVAKIYAYCRTLTPDDLLQEAVYRALKVNDGRKCPRHVDVVRFLAEAMRSIADGEIEKTKKITFVPVASHAEPLNEAVDPVDPNRDPEETLAAKQHEAAILRAALAPFDDDPSARDIVEGTLAGLSGEELRQLTGLDQTAYDSKRRLIRRRIDKTYTQDGCHDRK